jgi:dienelactone hydrolase
MTWFQAARQERGPTEPRVFQQPQRRHPLWVSLAVLLLAAASSLGAGTLTNTVLTPAEVSLASYFQAETRRLSERCLTDIRTVEDWQSRRARYRQEAAAMLGLWPEPARSELKPVVTGRIEHDEFAVDKLHFQSQPCLYVTANLYVPKGLTGPAPTILYLCGHGAVITNGVSYGNKVSYQHHGIWFARHGYVCLVVDTLQLGEIQGQHHGTYREGAWWWNSCGYTPAGVEAWNNLRALDYLCTRPEVDTNRFGVTGRSGGGAYSWTLAALDDRVRAGAPVAGITDLQNHVVDGTVEGHCDCMFFVNTYRWDYPQLAALVAPRPLLLVNTDADTIFPLDGVLRTHAKLKRLYALHNAAASLGLVIGPGPHKDTQDLQVPVFRWFNRHLKGEDSVITQAAVKLFTPQQLKVFDRLPEDAINTNIQHLFVPKAAGPGATTAPLAPVLEQLRQQCFAAWPEDTGPVAVRPLFRETRKGVVYEALELVSQPHVALRLYVMARASARRAQPLVLRIQGTNQKWHPDPGAPAPDGPSRISEVLGALGLEPAAETTAADALGDTAARACFWPRGLGPGAWPGDARKQTHLRRRFMLLGQTLEGMRVWDIRCALQALQAHRAWARHPLRLEAEGDQAVNALYASLFEPPVAAMELSRLPSSHLQGPDYLNVLKVLDVPQAAALASARGPVRVQP